jgi:hypothetical protein
MNSVSNAYLILFVVHNCNEISNQRGFGFVIEMVRLNIVYDLMQTTKLCSNTKENDKILQRTNQAYFAICNSCFWCASYFGIDDLSASSTRILDCHVCNTHTKLMPIYSNESFKIELAN